MPWKTVEEAEKKVPGIKNLSSKAKSVWLGAFNSCYKDKGDSKSCYAIAYGAARKADKKASEERLTFIASRVASVPRAWTKQEIIDDWDKMLGIALPGPGRVPEAQKPKIWVRSQRLSKNVKGEPVIETILKDGTKIIGIKPIRDFGEMWKPTWDYEMDGKHYEQPYQLRWPLNDRLLSRLEIYKEAVDAYDWFYSQVDDNRVAERGRYHDEYMIKLYSSLNPVEKQMGYEYFISKAPREYKSVPFSRFDGGGHG